MREHIAALIVGIPLLAVAFRMLWIALGFDRRPLKPGVYAGCSGYVIVGKDGRVESGNGWGEMPLRGKNY
jgi:hypothetical protein